jgi:hypothetical protein
MKSRTSWILLIAALIIGGAITWVDTRTTWDDTGITAGIIFLSTLVLGILDPKRAWLWPLAVGGWIPVIGTLVNHNAAPSLALIVAIIGAFAGALSRKFVSALQAIT